MANTETRQNNSFAFYIFGSYGDFRDTRHTGIRQQSAAGVLTAQNHSGQMLDVSDAEAANSILLELHHKKCMYS